MEPKSVPGVVARNPALTSFFHHRCSHVVGTTVGDAKLELDGKADRIEGNFRTPSAASKARSKENRCRGCMLRSLRTWTSRVVGESVQFCSDGPRDLV